MNRGFDLHYIILDLEWNTAYARRIKGFINEIIEVGAVMLDDNLNTVDEFSCFIKAQVGKKLRSNVKKLTNITNEDISSGILFTRAMSKFRDWIGSKENVILTWGDGDIRVLIENFKYLNGINTIPFLSNYVDIQAYVQETLGVSKAQQIGLAAAAETLGINLDDFSHHRALDDSKLTAECFRRTFEQKKLAEKIKPCNNSFYEKLAFKPYAISNINSPIVDTELLSYKCEKCGTDGELIKDWRFSNQFFRAVYRCPVCGTSAKVAVRFKKYYDHIETKKNISIIKPDDGSDNQTDE